MSAKTEADVAELQTQMKLVYAAVHALMERIELLEMPDENNAVTEGSDIPVKATPNGKAKKAHR